MVAQPSNTAISLTSLMESKQICMLQCKHAVLVINQKVCPWEMTFIKETQTSKNTKPLNHKRNLSITEVARNTRNKASDLLKDFWEPLCQQIMKKPYQFGSNGNTHVYFVIAFLHLQDNLNYLYKTLPLKHQKGLQIHPVNCQHYFKIQHFF